MGIEVNVVSRIEMAKDYEAPPSETSVASNRRLYHVSKEFFTFPDPAYARIGDGNSSHGLGFYTSSDLAQIDYYLNVNRAQSGQGKIRYEVDLRPDANIVDAFRPVSPELLDRAQSLAISSSMPELASGIDTLQTTKTTYGTEHTFSELEHLIERHFPLENPQGPIFEDQRKVNAFLRGMGVDGVERMHDVRIINYNAIKTFKVDEIIGDGPINLREGVTKGAVLSHNREGDFSHQRIENFNNITIDYTLRGIIYSIELTIAWEELRRQAPELATKFKPILDDFHLDPKIGIDGFGLREKVGIALRKALNGVYDDDFGTRPANLAQVLGDLGLPSQNRGLYNRITDFFETDLRPFMPDRAPERRRSVQHSRNKRQPQPQ